MKRLWMKKALSLSLALLMLLSLVACGGNDKADNDAGKTNTSDKADSGKTESGDKDPGSDSQASELKERVVIGMSGIMTTRDPHFNVNTVDSYFYEMTHNTLIEWNTETKVFDPELAESWEMNEDGTVVTFKLREDVDFQNGEHFTAADVVYSYDRAMQSAAQLSTLENVESVEAVDEYTVQFNLKSYDAEFYENVIDNDYISILNEKAINEDPDNGPSVGTGAYILSEWVPSDHVTLTRNENYWGELPPSKEILVRAISEPSARVVALQTGEIDVCYSVPGIEAANLADSQGCELIQVPNTTIVYLAMNVSGTCEPLMDENLRLALIHATDPEGVILGVKEGYADLPNGPIPQGLWGYDENVQPYHYDLEKAKEYMAASNYPDGLELDLMYRGDRYPGLFEVLQAQWAQIGVTLNLQTDDPAVYSDLMSAGTYEVAGAQIGTSTIGYMVNLIWTSGASANMTRYGSEEMDKLLSDAMAERDTEKRAQMYAELQQMITDTKTQIPLYINMDLHGHRVGVTGINYKPDGCIDYTYVAATK